MSCSIESARPGRCERLLAQRVRFWSFPHRWASPISRSAHPLSAIVIEDLAALGVKTIVGVGTAGGLSPDLEIGQIVVCSAAIRDEGTSHHYAPAGRWAVPDSELLGSLRSAFPEAVVGPSWTTDAPYRETAEEIAAYGAEGILTVDMEASALFTVGAKLGVQAASVFCISDVLHGEEWEPHFQSPNLADTLWQIFEAVESMLLLDGSNRITST